MALRLNPCKDRSSIPPCTPNLMPFSIDYTGPAPVSTYLRVLPASDRVGAPSVPAIDASNAEPDASTSLASKDPVPTRPTRFVSKFRGRAIQGVSVEMPTGYTGVVLTSDGTQPSQPRSLKSKIKETIKKVGSRTTRRSRAASVQSETDQEEEEDIMDVDPEPLKTLTIVSQFNSFVLWNPDIPVDEGRDDYMRSLNEWIRISEVLHRPIE